MMAAPFTLTFGSTLNEPAFNESWGSIIISVTSAKSSTCAGKVVWGGYQVCGMACSATKTLTDLLPGEYYLSFDFLHIDSWDGEEGYLFL